MLTAQQMEEATGVSARWWRDEARAGRVEHARYGRQVRFPAYLVDAGRRRPLAEVTPTVRPNPTGLSPRSRIARQVAVQARAGRAS